MCSFSRDAAVPGARWRSGLLPIARLRRCPEIAKPEPSESGGGSVVRNEVFANSVDVVVQAGGCTFTRRLNQRSCPASCPPRRACSPAGSTN